MDFGAFMQALSNGQHAKYADKTKTAFSKQGVREGTGILKHLFGSKKNQPCGRSAGGTGKRGQRGYHQTNAAHHRIDGNGRTL